MTDDYNENTAPVADHSAENDLFRQDENFSVPPPPPAALMAEKDHTFAPIPPAVSDMPKVQMFADGEQKRFAEHANEKAPANVNAAPVVSAKIHLEPSAFSPDVKYGELLRYAREKAGFSVEQIAEKTKLRTYYLYAMEDDQPDRLPPSTYVSSYIRSLCLFYRLDDASVEFLRKRFNAESAAAGDSSIPQTLIETMGKDAQISETEDLRIKKMFRFFAVILILMILLIGWAVYAILQAGNKSDTDFSAGAAALTAPGPRPEMTMEEFDSLTAPQVPDISTLDMTKRPKVNRSNSR